MYLALQHWPSGAGRTYPFIARSAKTNRAKPRRVIRLSQFTKVPTCRFLRRRTISPDHCGARGRRDARSFHQRGGGALNVAADAVWDDTQRPHARRDRVADALLGWRGPYALTRSAGTTARGAFHRLGRAAEHRLRSPPNSRRRTKCQSLARSEAALHSNGDLSNSHYDMNLVYIDALFRHLLWTGDLDFARADVAGDRAAPRLGTPAVPPRIRPGQAAALRSLRGIWASDDLQYNGGGMTHASAYNYYHNNMAARLAKLLGHDPRPTNARRT